MKKILMVIAKVGFRDEEFDLPFQIFKSKGYSVDIASTESGECIGKFGMRVKANIVFKDINSLNYIAVVLVGGPGSATLVNHLDLNKILTKFSSEKKIISAICYAPVILARTGLLAGKKATVWNNDGLQSVILKEEGAVYVKQSSVIDGLTITADGPSSASEFANNVLKVIERQVNNEVN